MNLLFVLFLLLAVGSQAPIKSHKFSDIDKHYVPSKIDNIRGKI